ncbi:MULTISPECIES: nuclear transport factor 2 family protein [Mycobacteriaceae]|uniref:nuclear transport factor 2 family protein n=1 Tax=Mycobacteriaceae TaxID=1762 RepID=UPI0007FCCEBC|nr:MULTISPECIES: nuclear transport factor 2 family protein [Mycobacteriaceae]MCK0176712.1 nuclear transport factor 2 family protein [Mycolicibacterium sp. F2034L]OBB56046.1 hypothetical protein A5757_03180 [Mycobacterium sp. 852013-51886_SCH5428379]
MNDDALARLERRVQRMEDERAVERLIASYGPLVDAGESDAAAALWAADGVYDVEGWQMRSSDEVAAMVRSDGHRGLIARGCCHFLGPAVVTVDGDSAVAVCESIVVTRRAEGFAVWRAAANHFRLRRIDGRWRIAVRTTRALDGGPEAPALLADGVAGR